MYITNSVGRTAFSADSRDAQKALGLLSNGIQEASRIHIGDIVGDFEFAVSTNSPNGQLSRSCALG